MRYYIAILFMLFIFPVAYKEYKKDSNSNISAKYINILLTLTIFSVYTNVVCEAIREYLNNYEVLKLTYQISIGFESDLFGMSVWGFYIFFSFIISLLAISIALRKNRARVLFLRLIPFVWILESFHLYKLAQTVEDIKLDNLFLYCLLINGVLASLFFLLYNSKFMTKFFQFEENISKE